MSTKQQLLALLEPDSDTGAGNDVLVAEGNGSTPLVGDFRIDAALAELQQARIRSMSVRRAEVTLRTLSRISSITASLMHDITTMLNNSEETNADPVEVLRHGARLPTRESKRLAKVGKQLEEMPQVKERLASGDITPDHAKALANAAEKVGPETVEADKELLEAADRMLPDSFNRHARRWADRKQIEAGIDILEQQRQSREAKMWVEKETGLGVLMAKMPRSQFELVRQAVDYHYLQLLRKDGDDPDGVRSPTQRLHDVLFELLTNRDADTGQFLPEAVGVKAKAATQIIIVANLDVIDGTNPDGQVEMLGVGPVPPGILETFTEDTQIAGMIYGKAGRILWLGHNQRLGNAAQRLAVAIRDRGCFQCGAPMHRCELHHIDEWHKDGGRTDIDNLVAVCRKHHRMLEEENLKVVRTPNGGYQTRPRDRPG